MIKDTKNLPLIIVAIFALVAAGIIYFYSQQGVEIISPTVEQTTTLKLEKDLTPIELTEEEKKALKEEGIDVVPTGEDAATRNLRTVNISDELGVIATDLETTNLSGIDVELEQIDEDLSGL